MTTRSIKIIAILTMTIDHVGVILYPRVELLRIIGRISFPLFAFVLAFGCTKTRNIGKYFLRLIACAVWFQIIWAIGGFIDSDIAPEYNNIFFTLAFGVLGVWILGKTTEKNPPKNPQKTPLKRGGKTPLFSIFLVGFSVGFLLAISEVLAVDYGWCGVGLVLGFWAMFKVVERFDARVVVASVILFFYTVMSVLVFPNELGYLSWYALLALPFMWVFSTRKIKAHPIEKYAFYFYYPLHFVVIYLFAIIL